VGDNIGMAVFGDESSIKDPQEFVDNFRDRIKEVIKCQNKWFGPSEVEESIESIPGVVEACIWSTYDVLKCDDIVHAAVTVNKADITKETIITHVSNNLPSHKHITGQIFFLDSIPHNPQGKKMRRVLILKTEGGTSVIS